MILLLILFPFFLFFWFFCFNDTATTEIYTLSLHDALPIWWQRSLRDGRFVAGDDEVADSAVMRVRSEEHTSELQSRSDIGCRLLLENNYNGDSQEATPSRGGVLAAPRRGRLAA